MTSPKISERTTRVVLVTAGLSLVGGLVGAFCGAATVAAIAAIERGPSGFVSHWFANIVGVSAGFGAVAGMIGAPIVGWGLLRRVALGRAMSFTAVGTVVGAVAGELTQPLNPHARDIPGVLLGAFVGFVVGGIVARVRTRTIATVATEPLSDR